MKEDNNWSCTSQQGFRFKTDANGKIIEKLGKIRASTEFDSLLEQVTITREDFVNISVVGIAPTKNYFSFSKSTKGSVDYFDGTSISSDKGTIEIKHSLYASVTFNEGVSRVTLPNGVVIEKNGSKFTIKTSNSLVQFDESGNLYHLPVLAANDQLESVFTGKKTLSSIDLSSLPHVHIMNIKNDTYLHTDFDSTISEVKNNIASVSGKGELPKNSLLHVSPGTLTNNLISHFATSTHSSSITEPENVSFNSPRLFLINIDGSGVELLRDRDMYLELRRQLHNKKSEIMEERVEGEDGSVCVTILDHGAVNSNNGKAVRFRQVSFI